LKLYRSAGVKAGMSQHVPLDVIEIETPCAKPWNEMSGDDRTRFCDHCHKQVFDVSAMPREEAERLVCEKAGSMCVRFARDARGAVITLDYAPPRRRRKWPLWTGVGLVAALAGALGIYARTPPKPTVRPMPLMGVMKCPTPAPTPAPSQNGQ
jgi:hypothetical protein